jgi:hypothetical protein
LPVSSEAAETWRPAASRGVGAGASTRRVPQQTATALPATPRREVHAARSCRVAPGPRWSTHRAFNRRRRADSRSRRPIVTVRKIARRARCAAGPWEPFPASSRSSSVVLRSTASPRVRRSCVIRGAHPLVPAAAPAIRRSHFPRATAPAAESAALWARSAARSSPTGAPGAWCRRKDAMSGAPGTFRRSICQ